MKILSIETSGKTCGVALSDNGQLLGEYSLFTNNLHDKMLAELTNRLLNDFKLEVNNLDAVAVSSGPGSYTGLRIGAAFAKALTFGNKPKLIAVPTLNAFAGAAQEFAVLQKVESILSIIHSHKDIYYTQIFDLEINTLNEIIIQNKEEIINENISKSIVYTGSFIEDLDIPTLSGLNRHSPRFISRLANQMYVKNEFVLSESFVPLYVQDFVVK